MLETSINLLYRWMALDDDLYHGRLRVSEFAHVWMVDRKTVRRDLALFKRLGYEARCEARRPGREDGYVWRYVRRRPMFTKSLE